MKSAISGLQAKIAVAFDLARDGTTIYLVRRNDRIVEVITDPSPAEVAADAIQRLQDAMQ